MKIKLTRYSPWLAALLAITVNSQAVEIVLLDESFTAADRMTQALPESAAWFCATASADVVHDAVAGTFTLQAAASASRHIVAYFTDSGPVNLQPGETIRVEYEMTMNNPHSNEGLSATSNSFRVGLFNSNLVGSGMGRVDADNIGGVSTSNATNHYGSYIGYRFDTIPHTNTTSPAMRVFRRNAGFANSALIVITTAYTGALAASPDPTVLFQTGIYHGVVEITRGEEGGLSYSHHLVSADSGLGVNLTVAGTDADADAVYGYDTIAFGLNSRVADSFTLHNVKVTHVALDPDAILADEFTAADRYTQNLPVSAAWFSGTDAEHVVHDPDADTLTLVAAASSSRHMLAYFTDEGEPAVELEPGATLRLAYDLTLVNTDAASTLNNSFRFGLFNSNLGISGVQRINADGMGGVSSTSTPSHFHTYVGYRFDTIPHTNATAPQMRVYRRQDGFINSALIVITTAYTSTPLAVTETPHVLLASGLYHGVIEVTRTGGGVSFSHHLVSDDESIAVSITGFDGSPDAVYSFDTIALGINSRVAEALTLHRVEITKIEPTVVEPTVIQVGPRLFQTEKFTKAGTPVVPMWDAPMPTVDRRTGAGFPVLTEAEHTFVWQPATTADGAFNHYAAIINYEGRFFTMWGNHPNGEDKPGQRILYAWSDAWGEWSQAMELFPAPGPVSNSSPGIHLKADRWAIVNGKLYAIVYVFEAGGSVGRYPIAREVSFDGTLGDPFLVRTFPDGAAYPSFMTGYTHTTALSQLAAQLRVWYVRNSQVSWWARTGEGVPGSAIDGASLIESFSYRAKDGGYVLFNRNWGTNSNPVHNNRLYVSFSNSLAGWALPYPTDIPDSPSRAEAVTLGDGTILLIGNQNAHTFDVPMYLDRDPITVSISDDGLVFDRVFALRTNAPQTWRFSGITGRNIGFAYSSSTVHKGWLYTFYSIGKEDMGITRVPLTALGLLIDDTSALYDGAVDLGEGWQQSPWFGLFWDDAYPYVHSPDLGWLYVFGAGNDMFYAYHWELGWIYSGAGLYPYLYAYGPEGQGWYLADGTKL
jgi:hypothetical protein